MAQVTIDLTEQQVHFLKEFAAKHYPGAHDNLITEKPIHIVQTRRERVIDSDYDSADRTVYLDLDSMEDYDSAEELIRARWEDEECPIPIVSFNEAYDMAVFIGVDGEEHVILDEKDYFKAYGIDKKQYNCCSVEYYWEPVAFFWILDEAKKYMEYQGHNLCSPRTYTMGPGYANRGGYTEFWDLLFNLGAKLNEQSPTKEEA